jgi:hypothetical protein
MFPWWKEKEDAVYVIGVPILMGPPYVWEHPWAHSHPSSGEPTCLYMNLPSDRKTCEEYR